MTETYIEKRKRGFFGWIFLLLFLGWNLLMVVWFFSAMSGIGNMPAPNSSAEETGRNIGTALGVGMILAVWAFGSVITGLLALLTRGSKVIIKKV